MTRPDLVFVGGGLAASLAAYRTAACRPGVALQVLERGERLGGSHFWSFHDADVSADQLAWLEPLVARRWPRYEVRFPDYRRVLETGYRTIDSGRLHAVVAPALGAAVRLGVGAETIAADHVVLAGGAGRVEARTVVDARGLQPSAAMRLGYQKFLGQVLEFERPIGLAHPIVMDATVDQSDGFRFVYVLPFSERTALVEDTYYSRTADISAEQLRGRIAQYASASGWAVRAVTREEVGVLPIPLAGDFERFWPPGDLMPRVGLRAGLFHPTTGFSLPQAAATADLVGGLAGAPAPELGRALRSHARAHWRRGGFFRALNRMLLLAGRPVERYRVLERFYRLPAGLIGRFYAGRPTLADRARLLVGSPPVPVAAAVAALLDTDVPGPASESAS